LLVRLIDPPEPPLALARHRVVVGRPPFAESEEVALLRQHRIDTLVAKNSGGEWTYGKIAAARRLGLPVVMVRRPAPPTGQTVASVAAALAWISGH
jgi:precorrin-6A/cobalt-precorrin-6A reductase